LASTVVISRKIRGHQRESVVAFACRETKKPHRPGDRRRRAT
jgi:hypothetical protein